MASRNIWADVEERIKKGIPTVVKISEAAKVSSKGGKVGRRKKVRNINKPYEHYAMHTPGGKTAMSCRAPGCGKRMRSTQADIVCSDACRTVLTEYCEVLLSILKGERQPEELPPHMRTHKIKRMV